MNFIHLKYAIEVAKAGSINKAAKKLLIRQPNLSRAIKELESSLGVSIFDRSAKGMVLTPEGETFMGYAESILKQVDAVKHVFQKELSLKKRFSISVPRASYIAEAFARFSQHLNFETDVEVFYRETNATRAIKNILQKEYKLGIIRYAQEHDIHHKAILEEEGLHYEPVAEFQYILLMNQAHPLAQKREILMQDLKDFIEISHADSHAPLSLSKTHHQERPDAIQKKIFVFDRSSQFEILSRNINTFMWASAVPKHWLSRYGLVQRHCKENHRIYKDMLIYSKNYSLSPLDQLFLSELCQAKREILTPLS